jgi:hypothetical protein
MIETTRKYEVDVNIVRKNRFENDKGIVM